MDLVSIQLVLATKSLGAQYISALYLFLSYFMGILWTENQGNFPGFNDQLLKRPYQELIMAKMCTYVYTSGFMYAHACFPPPSKHFQHPHRVLKLQHMNINEIYSNKKIGEFLGSASQPYSCCGTLTNGNICDALSSPDGGDVLRINWLQESRCPRCSPATSGARRPITQSPVTQLQHLCQKTCHGSSSYIYFLKARSNYMTSLICGKLN